MVGTCTKCSLKVKMASCKKGMVARLMIEDDEGKTYTVTAFQNVIEDVIQGQEGEDVTEKLISAPPLTFTITKKDILVAVSK